MIRAWLRAAATAVQFLTRLPVPGGASATPDSFAGDIGRALLLFPLVGALIGGMSAAVLLLAATVWPLPIAVLLALAVEAGLTGALHEDAVADLCDGLGGGRTAEDVLRIFKDSRLGSYGVLGLGLAVALRAAGLMALSDAAAAALVLVVAGAFGRLLMLATMAAVPAIPGRAGLAGSVAPAIAWPGVALAAALAVPVWLLGWGMLLPAVPAALLFLWWYRALLLRRIGGSTGDAIGAAGYAGILIATLVASLAGAR